MSISLSKSQIMVLLIVAIGIVIVLLFLITNTTHKNEPEHYRPYIYADIATSDSNAITVGIDATASSKGNATVYGKPVPKNVSIVPYLDDNNKLQVKEVVERQNHTGQGEP